MSVKEGTDIRSDTQVMQLTRYVRAASIVSCVERSPNAEQGSE